MKSWKVIGEYRNFENFSTKFVHVFEFPTSKNILRPFSEHTRCNTRKVANGAKKQINQSEKVLNSFLRGCKSQESQTCIFLFLLGDKNSGQKALNPVLKTGKLSKDNLYRRSDTSSPKSCGFYLLIWKFLKGFVFVKFWVWRILLDFLFENSKLWPRTFFSSEVF